MTQITLPKADGGLERYRLGAPKHFDTGDALSDLPRIAYAAAHVVADPLADNDPWIDCAIDWDATLAYRHHLWGLGFGVAEAMDTAQRGMGLDWPTSLELIGRSVAAASGFSGKALIASGAGTDHLQPRPDLTIDDVIAAYEEQCSAVEAAGGRIILMASRALAACAKGPEDYLQVYNRVVSQTREPVIIHWLGGMFDPALGNYWGYTDHFRAMDVCLEMLRENAAKIDGIKVSLLDDKKEIVMRRRLPGGVLMYTGDDFNYPDLIAGDARGYSHALLGIFDAVAPAASAALKAFAGNDMEAYSELLAPTVPLSRHIFKAPTRFYKTGIVFMAYLNGHQAHFTMVGGQQGARSALHLGELVRLADKAGLLNNPERAAKRAAAVLATCGVEG
ncbi:MAG: dihydrodipicolinate synthase family protein [Hyphomicrobiales bacterium]|nr:dihydrodipicolinate synthase family protein [Hyphomicrobiales bacterium]